MAYCWVGLWKGRLYKRKSIINCELLNFVNKMASCLYFPAKMALLCSNGLGPGYIYQAHLWLQHSADNSMQILLYIADYLLHFCRMEKSRVKQAAGMAADLIRQQKFSSFAKD